MINGVRVAHGAQRARHTAQRRQHRRDGLDRLVLGGDAKGRDHVVGAQIGERVEQVRLGDQQSIGDGGDGFEFGRRCGCVGGCWC